MLRDPFTVDDEAILYVPRAASERVLGELDQALRRALNPVALIGAVGIGKSLLFKVVAQRLASQACCVPVRYEGWSVADIASDMKLDPKAATAKLLEGAGRETICLQFGMSEEDVETNLAHPLVMVGSDGIPVLEGKPHPRLFGTFPRVLGEYSRQRGVVPLEEAIEEMTNRVPNLDLRFFATAVVLQRQTGGDLAEILDKIGYLVRERFKIWGQIQALTGEGRLSGVVLLALPPVLFVAMWYLNPNYAMTLFTDPMGHQMLAGAIISQIIGALVIKKIVNIKV